MAKRNRKKNAVEEIEMTGEELRGALASGKIKFGPIRHPDLPELVLDLSRRIYEWVGKDSTRPATLERWETNFMRDCNPIQELAVWVVIGLAADRLCQNKANRHDVVLELIVASSGAENEVKPLYDEVARGCEGLSFKEIFKRIPQKE